MPPLGRQNGSPRRRPKANGPSFSPEPDISGEIGSELREQGVQLPPPGGRSATGEPSQPVADPARPDQEKVVHVYEMLLVGPLSDRQRLYADFRELYQLLFHLGSVSVNNVLAAAIHFMVGRKRRRSGICFSQAQGFVGRAPWPGPSQILNLYMSGWGPRDPLPHSCDPVYPRRESWWRWMLLAAVLCAAGSGFALE